LQFAFLRLVDQAPRIGRLTQLASAYMRTFVSATTARLEELGIQRNWVEATDSLPRKTMLIDRRTVFRNRQWLGLGLLSRRKKQYFLTLGQSASGNHQQLLVSQLIEGDITAIEHLDRLSVQPVGDFANSGKFAFLGLFDQLGCDPAQRHGIAP
jgi:hypothetical protein